MGTPETKCCRECGAPLNPEYGKHYDLCTTCREAKGEVIVDSIKTESEESRIIRILGNASPSDPIELAREQVRLLSSINSTLTFFKYLAIIGIVAGIIALIIWLAISGESSQEPLRW